MCKHSLSPTKRPRFGYRLEHGEAHSRDHARWSRRDFLAGLGLTAAGALTLGSTPVRSFAGSPLLSEFNRLETDRVLVLIQLSGGNDGLNAVIPYENDIYYQRRPTLAISRAEAQQRPLGMGTGLHPALAPLEAYYGEGEMAILQNVGYPSPNMSHFRSTDIWLSAGNGEEVVKSGWVGRHLEAEFPSFNEERLDFPLAVQIGGVSSLLTQGSENNMGMSLVSVDFFERLSREGILYNMNGLPSTAFGNEMGYVRSVANDSFIYADSIQQASGIGVNSVAYPDANPLSESLPIVARLIKGQLGARIYHVTLSGFDTHAKQADLHGRLLRYLAEGVDAFMQDVTAGGMKDNILVMTFSEFGRRVDENGSAGTDHGTAAPLFLFGSHIDGGLYGNAPDLSDLDAAGNLKHEIDFRTVYATILQDWFGVEAAVIRDVLLGHACSSLGFVENAALSVSTRNTESSSGFTLHSNYPNPFADTTTISFSLDKTGRVLLQIFDIAGRQVRTLVNAVQASGTYRVDFHGSDVPAGVYVCRLTTSSGVRTRKMVKR